MQKITDPISLSELEINYRCEGLLESQLEILSHLTCGKSDIETANILSMSVALLRSRLASACDRVGVDRRAQLIAMYSVWKFSKREKDTEYQTVGENGASLSWTKGTKKEP